MSLRSPRGLTHGAIVSLRTNGTGCLAELQVVVTLVTLWATCRHTVTFVVPWHEKNMCLSWPFDLEISTQLQTIYICHSISEHHNICTYTAFMHLKFKYLALYAHNNIILLRKQICTQGIVGNCITWFIVSSINYMEECIVCARVCVYVCVRASACECVCVARIPKDNIRLSSYQDRSRYRLLSPYAP